jgi:hypothetical protein
MKLLVATCADRASSASDSSRNIPDVADDFVFGFPSGFGYIDLENTSSPAIGGKAGLPAWLVSAVAGSALPAAPPPQAPAVAPSPTPTPTPTLRPTPTPWCST